MYIAMNRFKVARGQEEAFEEVWRNRESSLKEMDGFLEFHMLRGAAVEDHTLYASHTTWRSYDQFVAWTKSEQFAKAHRSANGTSMGLFLGHPQFEGFQVVEGI
jgi:heme-degrading monooxygenase HmoA